MDKYYKVLLIQPPVTKDKVKKAYRDLALLYHPDKQETEEDKKIMSPKFQEINEAKDKIIEHLDMMERTAPKTPPSTSTFTNGGKGKRKRDASDDDGRPVREKEKTKEQEQREKAKEKAKEQEQRQESKQSGRQQHVDVFASFYHATQQQQSNGRSGSTPSSSYDKISPTEDHSHLAKFFKHMNGHSSSSSSSSTFMPPPQPRPPSFAFPFAGMTSSGSGSNGSATGDHKAKERKVPVFSRDDTTASPLYARVMAGYDVIDTHKQLQLSLRDFYCGTTRRIPVNSGARCRVCHTDSELTIECRVCHGNGPRCTHCDGTGLQRTGAKTCKPCEGIGKIIHCKSCKNRGYVEGQCPRCQTNETVPETRVITVRISPGKHRIGTTIRLVGCGESSHGDLVLRLVDEGDLHEGGTLFGDGVPRPTFRRTTHDVSGLACTLSIELIDVLLGCEIAFRHLDGTIVRITAPFNHVLTPNEALVVDGFGLPKRTGGRGRLYVLLKWIMPTPGDLSTMRDSLERVFPPSARSQLRISHVDHVAQSRTCDVDTIRVGELGASSTSSSGVTGVNTDWEEEDVIRLDS